MMAEINDNEFVELVEKMKAKLIDPALFKDIEASLQGNKSASKRVRHMTVELGKIFKEYRAKSVAIGLV